MWSSIEHYTVVVICATIRMSFIYWKGTSLSVFPLNLTLNCWELCPFFSSRSSPFLLTWSMFLYYTSNMSKAESPVILIEYYTICFCYYKLMILGRKKANPPKKPCLLTTWLSVLNLDVIPVNKRLKVGIVNAIRLDMTIRLHLDHRYGNSIHSSLSFFGSVELMLKCRSI